MPLDLTFKQVCELIKKDDPKLIDAVDKLLGLALLCSPAIIGPAAAAALPSMIAVKNEIVKIGKGLFEVVTSKKDDDYLARQQRMEIAYGLICFTAFFEALDRQIPEPLREKIGLLKGEKISLVKSAQCEKLYPHETSPSDITMVAAANSPAALAAPFPHPSETLTKQIERNAKI